MGGAETSSLANLTPSQIGFISSIADLVVLVSKPINSTSSIRPLMPGVLIVEAMAQVGGLIVSQMPDLPKGLFVFAGIDSVRFRRPVVPGDQLLVSCELISIKRKRFGKVKGEAKVDDQLVCSGDLMFSLLD